MRQPEDDFLFGAADGTEIESRDIQNGDVILWRLLHATFASRF